MKGALKKPGILIIFFLTISCLSIIIVGKTESAVFFDVIKKLVVGKDIPVYSKSPRNLYQEEYRLNGIKTVFTGYEVHGDPLTVIEFYKRYYVGRGFRLMRFFKSDKGYVAQFQSGEYQYRVEAVGKRSGTETSVLVYKYFGQVLPASQFRDTPGEDVPEVPRYPASVRKMSFVINYKTFVSMIAMYNVAGSSMETVKRYYRDGLEKDGWKVIEEGPKGSKARLLGVKKNKKCVISVTPSETSGGLTVSVHCNIR